MGSACALVGGGYRAHFRGGYRAHFRGGEQRMRGREGGSDFVHFSGEVSAEERELRISGYSDCGAATAVRWRWARRPKMVGMVPGSDEAWVKPRGRSRTTKCGLSPGQTGYQNIPTGWISGSSSS